MTGKTFFKWLLFTVVVAGVAAAVYFRDKFNPQALEPYIAGLGVWGPVVFIGLWLVGPVIALPGAVLTLTGGALFGPLWGAVYTLSGATAGATLAFLVARYLAADWVEKRAVGVLGRVKEGVEQEGWQFLAFTRLVPLFPFNLLNYAFGLTRISPLTFAVTSFFFMAPGTAGYSYLGYAGREVVVGGGNLSVVLPTSLAILAALVALPIVIRRWRAGRKKPA